MESLNRVEEDGKCHWTFQEFTGYRKYPSNSGIWMVEVLWDNEEGTWELVSVVKKENPLEMA